MFAAIDAAGRVVIPKAVRESAHLLPGTKLRVSVRDGRVELEPEPREVVVVKRGRLHVAEPRERVGRLDAGTVRKALEEARGDRR